MPDIIRLLPDHVANQIAAGEVVQRPASVVKELLENSVDAGATAITLVVKDAGRTLIQVTDDGQGMSPADARMAFERHATSKIRVATDLEHVTTKGFRGEALASIAAIAQVEMRTRPHADELGTRLLIEGSRVRAQEAMAGAAGSTIAVRSLFYNVPARRQFLKSDAVEMKHVLDEFHRVALAHPEVAFKLVHNEQEELQLPAIPSATGNTARKQRIVALFGRRFDERLVPVEEATELVAVHGFVGKPEFARRTRGEQYFFVNGRFVRSPYLEHALRKAYEELLPRDAHPAWYLFLDLDPAQIDINIHPTKTEIKFRDDRAIYAIVHAAVRRALGRFNITPSIDFEPEPAMISAFSGGTAGAAPTAAPAWRPQDLGAFGAPPRQPPSGWQRLFDLDGDKPAALPDDAATRVLPSRDHDGTPGERPVFQLHGSYIIAQLRSGFMVLDQRRAHERILYERHLRSLDQGAGLTQTLLFPRNVDLAPGDHALLQELQPELRVLGLDIAPFGGHTIQVNGMPAETPDEDPGVLIESLLEQLRNEQSTLRNERHATLARSLACSMAMRASRVLDTAQMHALIDQLFACEVPTSTPGGKPTLITFGLEEINARFQY